MVSKVNINIYISLHDCLYCSLVLWHSLRNRGVSSRPNGSTTRRGERSGGLPVTFTLEDEDEEEDEGGDEGGDISEPCLQITDVVTSMHCFKHCLKITLSCRYEGRQVLCKPCS